VRTHTQFCVDIVGARKCQVIELIAASFWKSSRMEGGFVSREGLGSLRKDCRTYMQDKVSRIDIYVTVDQI
jgi:hypothetical protein